MAEAQLRLHDHKLVALLSVLVNERIHKPEREEMWLAELRDCAPAASTDNPHIEPLYDAAKNLLDNPKGADRAWAHMNAAGALTRFFEWRVALLNEELEARKAKGALA